MFPSPREADAFPLCRICWSIITILKAAQSCPLGLVKKKELGVHESMVDVHYLLSCLWMMGACVSFPRLSTVVLFLLLFELLLLQPPLPSASSEMRQPPCAVRSQQRLQSNQA
ncbi:hypothetical protein BC939DRAFT_469587 [Gamsiella multidivaricata]|uniref:uncharacterized protein n=1 Tax=Gamsiella multidivaricata TaxID=101098 RepID=UPI0022205A65|nr:uncharacterized protein BC939DRAFT_469587 [Gamsiella multidivaricata]KAI7816275.1 hypothetical protein BC939DRAFT_469587 [Gamsiella multidivaricata]